MTTTLGNWLAPEEHAEVVRRLFGYGLIKYDKNGNLPTKSGQLTDIYLNLRDARSHPEAIEYIATLFSRPLQRLGVDRFAEIPDSVSCFAGPIAIYTKLPYLTIREKPKEGRVADSHMIGAWRQGDRVAIIDDVVTDGASKIEPAKLCLGRGLELAALIVLVDREQGWKERFAEAGLNVPVWAGMRLYDLRRELVLLGETGLR